MNLDINFEDEEMAIEFAQMLREENVQGLRIKHEHKISEAGSLASPEFMEIITLAVNPVVLGTVSTVVLGALKTFFSFKSKEKEEEIKGAERILELEKKKMELASKERIEMAKIALERERLALEKFKNQEDNITKRLEQEVKEETERIRMMRDKK